MITRIYYTENNILQILEWVNSSEQNILSNLVVCTDKYDVLHRIFDNYVIFQVYTRYQPDCETRGMMQLQGL